MIRREHSTEVSRETVPTLDLKSIAGCWNGDPARIGMQFESVCFGPAGAVEAHIVTMCVRGFCPSVRSTGTYEVVAKSRLLLTLDGIGQEFIAWNSEKRLYLCDPVSGMTKSYLPASEES